MEARFPDKLAFLFEPHRYKVAYGGRGGAKSWGFARALLIQGAQQSLRILCARETQKSIKDSVHQLLEEQIAALGLQAHYRIEKQAMYGANGTEFAFAGLKHNTDNLKSFESFDICWVEEAQSVSKKSWDKLIPTIRKERSEIWASWNPDNEFDDTYQRFVVHPPPGAMVVKITWRDNPWFPEVLRREMEDLRSRDADEYNHIWEGCCINLLASAIYASELRLVNSEGRIRLVPYDRTRPVDCFWDLGYGDMSAVWFAQALPMEYRLIDYAEGSGRSIQSWLAELQGRGYVYGSHYLPWDVGMHAHTPLGGGKSIEQSFRDAGCRVKIVPKLAVADGINAARTVLPMCWFDEERTKPGVRALSHYRYGVVQTTDHPTREPLHDWASHGADAFRSFAVCIRQPQQEQQKHRQRMAAQVSPWS